MVSIPVRVTGIAVSDISWNRDVRKSHGFSMFRMTGFELLSQAIFTRVVV